MSIQQAVHRLYERRSSFVVFGLTGRTGSGCSTAARLLKQPFKKLKLAQPNTEALDPDSRKYRILHEYARNNWVPFNTISMTNVLATFLLERKPADVAAYMVAKRLLPDKQLEQLTKKLNRFANAWKTHLPTLDPNNQRTREGIQGLLKFVTEDVGDLVKALQAALAGKYSTFFQAVGDSVRASGVALADDHDPEHFYGLPERCSEIALLMKRLDRHSDRKRTCIVVDAIRNPFEALYFSERFANFYLVAVNTENETRRSRLLHLKFSPAQIAELDDKEYPERADPLTGYAQFVSQNIQACLQAADIFVHNPGIAADGKREDLAELTRQLVSYVALVQHPGLVTPTRLERCMQIAFTARANSGCISRQVGAVVTDKNFSVKGVGWNDVPAGQVPCLLRHASDLLVPQDRGAFSEFELTNVEFRQQLESSFANWQPKEVRGRHSAFCFRAEYNALKNEKNQVHTRSLHAEENAFLQTAKYGGAGVESGRLFTTASPCELCAKKAFQLGIREIYFIDPYPGISLDHILSSGKSDQRPQMHLFRGAIGSAYHRLYSPIRPYKDELRALMSLEKPPTPKGVANA